LASTPQATTGNGDALGFEPGDQAGNVHHHVDQQQISAAAGAQGGEGDFDRRGVSHLGAAGHGHLGGGAELAFEGSDDEQAHLELLTVV
jgi:hypothetical protein